MNPPTDPALPPDQNVLLPVTSPNAGGTPPPGAVAAPPVILDSPLRPTCKSSSWQQLLLVLLNVCLGLFIVGGVVSLLDDSLILLFGQHPLTVASGILTFTSSLLVLLFYGLSGLTPLVPKRVVLPLVSYGVLGLLPVFPVLIYHRNHLFQLDWMVSLGQVLVGLGLIVWLKHGCHFRWPIVEVRHLGNRLFSGWNLAGFLLVNGLVLLPAFLAYLALCAGLATSHFTDGFLTLRPGGLIMHSRKYVREDGKTVLLFPMSHIAKSDFYQAVSQSASSNSVVLLEGVSDTLHLLTNGLSYQRAAKAMGLAEQHDELNLRQGELVRADVDVRDFSPGTIGMLNLVGRMHARGLSASTLLVLAQSSPPPDVANQLWADVLLKRNEHLLKELRERLPDADNFVIPWGAIHMPGIAREIQKSGFRLVETREYVSIRFGPKGNKNSGPGKVPDSAASK